MLAEGKVVGWFHGRMEFGPRALGARSILGDPRSPQMQAKMNIKIKFREGFRPFAPSVLREHVADYFELDATRPTCCWWRRCKQERQIPMTDAAASSCWGIDKLNVPRSDIPAVTHIDYSARVQTVTAETNPDYYDLIQAFERLTGCPVLVNTSFNVRGEPIVCTPGGRLPLLHADAHRRSGARAVPARQGRPARVEGERELAKRIPARLTPRRAGSSGSWSAERSSFWPCFSGGALT